jgi:hypothetical protein
MDPDAEPDLHLIQMDLDGSKTYGSGSATLVPTKFLKPCSKTKPQRFVKAFVTA